MPRKWNTPYLRRLKISGVTLAIHRCIIRTHCAHIKLDMARHMKWMPRARVSDIQPRGATSGLGFVLRFILPCCSVGYLRTTTEIAAAKERATRLPCTVSISSNFLPGFVCDPSYLLISEQPYVAVWKGLESSTFHTVPRCFWECSFFF